MQAAQDETPEDDSGLDSDILERIQNMKSPVLNINFNESRYSVIRECAKSLGWKEGCEQVHSSIEWIDGGGISQDVYWGLNILQKINHFPGMPKICQKCQLGVTLNRIAKAFPDYYNFHPRTWSMPKEKGALKSWWQQQYNEGKPRPTLIVKPDGGCQGRGIFLTSDLKTIFENTSDELIAVQQYIPDPLLIEGYKFDLRIYCTVTSCMPVIRAFQHKQGIARFCTQKYSRPNKDNMGDQFMHLTNYAVNKKNGGEKEEGNVGTKWSLEKLKEYLKDQGRDIEKLERDLGDVVSKTLLSIQPNLAQEYSAYFSNEGTMNQGGGGYRCFEILGFDIMLDSSLKPWVIEVNHSPSFHCDSPLDQAVKHQVIQESLRLASIDADDLIAGEAQRRPMNISEQKHRIAKILEKRRGATNAYIASPSIKQAEEAKLLQLRIAYEDAFLGGFERILPVPKESRAYPMYVDILSYSPQFLKENPVTKMRRMTIKQERQKMEDSKMRDRVKRGDRPLWGGNRTLQDIPSIETVRRLLRAKRPEGEPTKLPRVASIRPTAKVRQVKTAIRVETCNNKVSIKLQSISFGGFLTPVVLLPPIQSRNQQKSSPRRRSYS